MMMMKSRGAESIILDMVQDKNNKSGHLRCQVLRYGNTLGYDHGYISCQRRVPSDDLHPH